MRVLIQQTLVVSQLGFKGAEDKAHQTVLVIGDVHCAQVVPQEGNALAHQILRGGNPAGHHSLVHLGLLSEVVYQAAVIPGDDSAAVLDGNLLLRNETGNEGCDVDLVPPIGNGFVPPLYIPHRDGGANGFQFQPLADLIEGVLVVGAGTHQAEVGVRAAVENGQNIGIALHKVIDHVQFGVDALHQTTESRVQLVFGASGLDGHNLAVDYHLGIHNRLFQVTLGTILHMASLLLPLTDDLLDAFRQLGNIFHLDIFTNLHGLLQLIIVECVAG